MNVEGIQKSLVLVVSCVTTPPSVMVFNVIVFYCCYYCSAGVIVVDAVVVDVIADVIVVVCTLMGVREYMGLVLVASRATTPPLPYYQLSPHHLLLWTCQNMIHCKRCHANVFGLKFCVFNDVNFTSSSPRGRNEEDKEVKVLFQRNAESMSDCQSDRAG